MESFLFAVNAVAPIILMVTVGYILKRIKFMSAEFVKASNKLVFHVFIPSLLFLNVYNIEDLGEIQLGFIAYAVVALLVIFALAFFVVMIATNKNERRGVLLQASFRSNYALIGISLASSLFGDAGVMIATLLSAVVIPIFNVFAVISLSIFRYDGKKPSIRKVFLNIAKNPMIQSVVAGVVTLCIRALFVKEGISFRLSDIKVLFDVLGYLSKIATPLALLGLGAQFEFSMISSLRKEIIIGTLMRTVVVPIFGLGMAYVLFRSYFNGAHFAAFITLFATPVAVSSVPMAQEMGGDSNLAGQLVVWTTIVSTGSVFISSFLLSLAGVF